MKYRNPAALLAVLAGGLAMAFSSGASAQLLIQDDFTQAHDTNSWKTFNGACLTAGDGTGTIPACVGLPYYQGQTLYGGNSGTLPDPGGSGALRFTNGNNSGGGFANGYNQAGSVISNFTFPTGAGIQVTFKTVTYRGNSGGSGHDGADGMSFFLMDGSLPPYDTGAFGGSLGYTCSNVNNDPTLRSDSSPRAYDGLRGGYIGLGIDEYGNFLNGVTNTLGESGTSATGDNTASGGGYQPNRIGLRGAGSISWGGLNTLDNVHYPTSLTAAQRASAVQNTCKTGYIWDYSNPLLPRQTTTTVPDYNAIPGAYKVLSGVTIAAESALTRPNAVPITYNLKITQDGLLSLSYSYNGGTYQPVISKQSITASNGALPASFRFGFAGSTGGSTNIHEILCFQAQPADLAGTSVGVNEKEAAKIQSGTQAYLAFYYPSNWTGRLTASNLLYNASTQQVSIASTANWDASCNLTGVLGGQSCPTTLVPGPTAAQAPTARTILTWNGTTGIPFEWGSLTTAQQNTLDQGDTAPINANRLSYLRGDRSNEINSSGVGLFRARDGVLGDIIDSSPTWVGPPSSPYTAVWQDLINPSASLPENSGTQNYVQYLAAAQTRLNVVYSGANDGLLHGFRSGSFDSSNNYVSTLNDGQEVLAYMPNAVLQSIHNTADSTLDYANSQYSHNFYVDATPDVDELFYGGTWHSWLVGGLGPGGSAIYALDVTNPGIFSENNPTSVVMGEWTPSSIPGGCAAGGANCGQSMGNTYGVPVIRRLHNGMWGIIFGNGYGSSTGDAGIFIITIDPVTAAKTFYYLSTGVAGSNGIASVAPADFDGDHITDYVYAGDLRGNVWRFDLTSSNPQNWAARSTPIFTTPAGQPITTKPMIVSTADSPARMMVIFGTGQKVPQTNLVPASFSSGTQTLYGVWDWDMTSWNSKAMTSKQYQGLTAPQTVTGNLEQQTLTPDATDPTTLDVTNNPVCWRGSTTCAGGAAANTEMGWYVNLPGSGEQIIYNPLLDQNAIVVNTTIPANNSPLGCQANTDTGHTLALSVSTGGLVPGFFKNYWDTNTGGVQTNGTGTPFIVTAGGNQFLLTQTLGNGNRTFCPPGSPLCPIPTGTVGPTGRRLTWIERR